MSSVDAGGAAAAADPSAARFIGRDAVFWRVLVRGGVLLMVTLGLYRFWLNTDIRRFLWANTLIGGESAEYSGTATELLRGFLIAIVILVPLYVVFLVSAFDIGAISTLLGWTSGVLIGLLTQYAIYRARDYRLTRTVFRGLRLHQTGSAWHYAVCAVFWWGLTLISFGIAYPFARASLERFKLRNTWYGDLPGRFEGSGLSLFARGMPLWFVVIMPVLGALGALLAIDWEAIAAVTTQRGDDIPARMEAASPGFLASLGFAVIALAAAIVFAAALFPAFQTLVRRWWISGLRLGGVTVTSRLRMRDVYRAYLRFLGYAAIFGLVILVGVLVASALVGVAFGPSQSSKAAEFLITALLVGTYVVSALGLSTIYQATAKLQVWKLTLDSLDMSGADMLSRARAAGSASSPIGEGLADALNIGGL